MVYMYRGLWGLGEIPSVIILTWCHSLFTNFSMKLSLIYLSFVWFTKTTNSIFVWLSIQCFLSSSGLLSIVFPSLLRWVKFNVFLIASIYWVKIMEWPRVRGRMIKIDKKRNFLSMLLEYYENLRLKENSQWKINCNNISVGPAGCAAYIANPFTLSVGWVPEGHWLEKPAKAIARITIITKSSFRGWQKLRRKTNQVYRSVDPKLQVHASVISWISKS